MRISKVEIKNFKRFDNLTIDLGKTPGRIIALVGPNGCGKSSVFDAFLTYNSQYIRNVGSSMGNIQDYKKDQGNPLTPGQNLKIFLESEVELGQSGEFNKRETTGLGNTVFSFRSPYRYSNNLLKTVLEQVPEIKENIDGAGFSNQLDDKITQNYSRLYIYYQNLLEKEDLKASVAKMKVIGELNKSIQECLDIEITSIGNVMDGKGTLFFKKINEPHIFDYNKLSTGEKECVDMLVDIFLRKEVYKETIYCIDEPELHLNTGIQRKLLKEIVEMIPSESQLWICTHSIGFLRSLQLDYNQECQIFDFGSGDYFNGSKIIEPIGKTRKNWSKIFETALEDLTGLIAPKKIIYCEGLSKPGSGMREKGFDAKIFNTIFETEFPETLFISSGGNTELEKNSAIALQVLNKAFIDVEIFILKDKDINSSGEPTTIEERHKFLKASANNRMLKRREIENYLFDKDLLDKYRQKNGLEFNEEEYLKLVSDINEEDLKPKYSEILKCCTSKNIGKEKFCLELSQLITPETEVYQELLTVIFI